MKDFVPKGCHITQLGQMSHEVIQEYGGDDLLRAFHGIGIEAARLTEEEAQQ